MTTQPIPTTTDDLISEIKADQIVPALLALSEIYCADGLERKSVLLAAAARIAELEQSQAALRRGIGAVAELIDNSSGVAGLHLNGDTATWGELRTGGRFEEWLREFDEAQEASL